MKKLRNVIIFTLIVCIFSPALAYGSSSTDDIYNINNRAYDLFMAGKYEEAFDLFKRAADKGSDYAEYYVGYCYRYGYGTETNDKEAAKWFKLSADQGNSYAQVEYGLCYEYGCGVAQSYKDAVKWYKLAAEQGNMCGQNNLGLCLLHGNGIEQDYEEAVKWFKASADQGYSDAQFNLGYSYENGLGVDQSYEEAFKLYKEAADQGNYYGQFAVGVCYYYGNGVGENDEEAVKWFKLSAEQDYADAMYALGLCYYNGYGVGQNYKEALKWFKKGAESGSIKAKLYIGYCYYYGYGTEQDYNEAVKWFKESAEQGSASAQNMLGVCYTEGRGVEKDYKEAVKWYRLSAEQGNATAQTNLARRYEKGQGVDQDYDEAVKWYKLAAENGNENAKKWLENNTESYKNAEFVKTGKDKQTADLTDAAGKEYKYITAQSTGISSANQTSTGTAVANWARVSAKGGKEINCYVPEGVEPEIIELQGVGNLLEDKDGYEWRCISVDVHFNQSFSAVWSWEDFYTLDQYDENMENSNITNGNTKADLGVSEFYVNYNGKKYECLLVSVDSYKAGTGGFNCIECYRVPAGYDGCVFGLIDSREFYLSNESSYVQGKSDNFGVIDGVLHGLGDVYFRLR